MRAKSGRTANQEEELDHYVALGCYFSGDCAGSCALWVYRNCLGCGGNCEISVFPVPGYLPGALYRRNERGEEVLELLNETWAEARTADLRCVRQDRKSTRLNS